MASKTKTGKMFKDTQVKPMTQGIEPPNDQTEDQLQETKIYQEEGQTLVEPKQAQS